MRRNEDMTRYHFWYAVVALPVAALCIICGSALFLAGVSGNVSWMMEGLGMKSNLVNAGPGLIIVIVGFFIICITRLRRIR